MKKVWKPMFILFTIMMISGCSNDKKILMKVHELLEQTVEIEEELKQNEKKMIVLEQKDEKLYDEIINLGTDNHDEITELSKEAIELLDDRLKYLELEKSILIESRETFAEIEPLINKIKKDEQREQLEKMTQTMMRRYEEYGNVYDHYTNSIQLTKEMYAQFQKESILWSELYEIFDIVNESYEKTLQANELFNEETVLYNQLKEEYYKTLSKN